MTLKIKTVIVSCFGKLRSKARELLKAALNKISASAVGAARAVLSALGRAWNGFVSFLETYAVEAFSFGFRSIGTLFGVFFATLFKNGPRAAADAVSRRLGELRADGEGWVRFACACSAAFGVAVCAASVWFWNVNTVAISVNTNGVCIGYASSTADYSELYAQMNSLLLGDSAEECVDPIVMKYEIVGKNSISTIEQLAERALLSQSTVSPAYGLFVDGELAVCAETEEAISKALDARVSVYTDDNTVESEILNDISIKYVFYSGDMPVNDRTAAVSISNPELVQLSVQTVTVSEATKAIPYDTLTSYDSTKVIGYKRVKTQGSNGTAEVTTKSICINGVVQESETVSTVVITEPTDKVIVCGTSTSGIAWLDKNLSSGGMACIWPIAVTDRMYISSYYGDSRNHKGMDITGPEGTEIYAAVKGIVTYVGSNPSGYGNYLIISHGNGYTTLYAHCSRVYAKLGQTVEAGDVIAACGRTGNATGNHLHFEVRINGTQVDPAPYLGI